MSTPALPEPNPDEPKKTYLRVNVRGKKSAVWKKMRKDFVSQVQKLLATTVDPSRGSTIGSELRSLGAAAVDLARAKLEKPILENALLEAQVDSLYAQASHIRAQAREANAKAEAQEIQNSFQKLKLLLEATKMAARMLGGDGDEMLSFIRDIDAFNVMIADVALLAGPEALPGASEPTARKPAEET